MIDLLLILYNRIQSKPTIETVKRLQERTAIQMEAIQFGNPPVTKRNYLDTSSVWAEELFMCAGVAFIETLSPAFWERRRTHGRIEAGMAC